jgi:hypothetical protein
LIRLITYNKNAYIFIKVIKIPKKMTDQPIYPELHENKSLYPATAPPLNKDFFEKAENTLIIESFDCISCNEKVNTYATPVVRTTCGHVYHLVCAKKELKNKFSSLCTKCSNETGVEQKPSNSVLKSETKPQSYSKKRLDTMSLTTNGNDTKTRELIEKYASSNEETPEISARQKGVLNPTFNVLSLLTKFDKDNIEEFTIEDFIRARLTIEQIYYKLELQTWEDLKRIGFKVEHLKDRDLFSVPFLNIKYSVSWDLLKTELSANISQLQKAELRGNDLLWLGFDISDIMKEKNKTKYFISFKLSIKSWINLGLTVNDLIELGIKKDTLDLLGWKESKLIKYLNLNTSAMKALKLL